MLINLSSRLQYILVDIKIQSSRKILELKSPNCDEIGWNTFPLVVVVCHGTKTCGSGRCNLLTNGRSYCFAAWQSEGNNSACVTTGLVTRGPL